MVFYAFDLLISTATTSRRCRSPSGRQALEKILAAAPRAVRSATAPRSTERPNAAARSARSGSKASSRSARRALQSGRGHDGTRPNARPPGIRHRRLCAVDRRCESRRLAGARLPRQRHIALRRAHGYRLHANIGARSLSQARRKWRATPRRSTRCRRRSAAPARPSGWSRSWSPKSISGAGPWRPRPPGLVQGAARRQAGEGLVREVNDGRAAFTHGDPAPRAGRRQSKGRKRRRQRQPDASRPPLVA